MSVGQSAPARCDDLNCEVIEEFRANGGHVGGTLAGTSLILLHHIGARTGIVRVTPLAYSARDDGRLAIVASNGGSPTHPDWYHNLKSAGIAQVEVGTDTYQVTVTEIVGEDRDRIFDEQARRYPGFAGYAEKTAGLRKIPVLALRRA